jgi:hypothetical protein
VSEHRHPRCIAPSRDAVMHGSEHPSSDRWELEVERFAQREATLEAEVQRLLCWTVGAYVDGDMQPALLARFTAHLATCEDCQREVVALGRVADQLRAMSEPA